MRETAMDLTNRLGLRVLKGGGPGVPPRTGSVILRKRGSEDVSSGPERPRDWLLLFVDGSPEPIDRVRIQKGMFLFSQRSKAPVDQKYLFRPYKYGPFSFELYPDLDDMVREGLLQEERVALMSSPGYSPTATGRDAANMLAHHALPGRMKLLAGLLSYVRERDFAKLLNDIYSLYPEYATRSVFRRA